VLPALRAGSARRALRPLLHKCAADIVRAAIEGGALPTRRAAAELLATCIRTLTPSAAAVAAALAADAAAAARAREPAPLPDLLASGFLQPLAAVWMRPDFEAPRDAYVRLAGAFFPAQAGAPDRDWSWAALGLAHAATVPLQHAGSPALAAGAGASSGGFGAGSATGGSSGGYAGAQSVLTPGMASYSPGEPTSPPQPPSF
jgi:hypothetical protein